MRRLCRAGLPGPQPPARGTEPRKTGLPCPRERGRAGPGSAPPCVDEEVRTWWCEPEVRVLLRGEAAVAVCTSALVLGLLDDGGVGGRRCSPLCKRKSSNRAVTINMSELLRAMHDCRIDFSAQLFSRVLARAISQCCRSCASALTPFPQLARANAELHVGIAPK